MGCWITKKCHWYLYTLLNMRVVPDRWIIRPRVSPVLNGSEVILLLRAEERIALWSLARSLFVILFSWVLPRVNPTRSTQSAGFESVWGVEHTHTYSLLGVTAPWPAKVHQVDLHAKPRCDLLHHQMQMFFCPKWTVGGCWFCVYVTAILFFWCKKWRNMDERMVLGRILTGPDREPEYTPW